MKNPEKIQIIFLHEPQQETDSFFAVYMCGKSYFWCDMYSYDFLVVAVVRGLDSLRTEKLIYLAYIHLVSSSLS